MTINISKPTINIREKLSELDFAKVPFQKMPSGSILQVVQGSTTTPVTISTTSATDTGLSASITPTSTSSKVLVLVSQWTTKLSGGSSNQGSGLYVKRDSTTVISNYLSGITEPEITRLRWYESVSVLDSPNTTSSVTYKTQVAAYNGNISVQFDSIKSTIILMEVAG
jgi:hypothetical protein